MLGEDKCILITTHPFGSILGSEEGPHHMLALNPLFMTIGLLVTKILSVFYALGGGQHFGTYTHNHSSIWLNSWLRRKPTSYACSQPLFVTI